MSNDIFCAPARRTMVIHPRHGHVETVCGSFKTHIYIYILYYIFIILYYIYIYIFGSTTLYQNIESNIWVLIKLGKRPRRLCNFRVRWCISPSNR